ncbi:MAG TPA: hypothetical protein PLW93_03370 [Candidatus Absconditabacterales bacterium]|nr:hypothetical protein [Candidatus Absconditabacterales bacterium]
MDKGEIKEGRDENGDFVMWNEEDLETLRKAGRQRVKELLHDFLNK